MEVSDDKVREIEKMKMDNIVFEQNIKRITKDFSDEIKKSGIRKIVESGELVKPIKLKLRFGVRVKMFIDRLMYTLGLKG